MASANITLTLDCKPILEKVAEVFDCIDEMRELIPEWHKEEHARIEAKARELCEFFREQIRFQNKAK